jgi:hypothetical protein
MKIFALFLWGLMTVPAQEKGLELYLLVGQSNMAGRGKLAEEDRKPVPGIFMLDKQNTWVPAAHPIHFDKKIAGYGLGLDFARTMGPGKKIGLIPCAVGGTSLDQWKKGGKLFTNAIKRLRVAQKSGTLKGILWHQGESDLGNAAHVASYPKRFTQFVADLRKEAGDPRVPFVAGELGRFLGGKNAAAPKINAAFASVVKVIPSYGVASSEGLKDKGDRLHFGKPALAAFGKRYAEVMKRLQKK